MAKRKLLNIKSHLENISSSIEDMLRRDKETKSGKFPNGLRLVPIDEYNLKEILLINKAILRKHSEKQTRKDIRI